MSHKTSNPLPKLAHKQLLLAQSNLNRRQLFDSLACLKNEACQVKNKINSIGSLAVAAARLTGSVSSFSRAFIAKTDLTTKGSSWASKFLNGLRTGVLIWGAIRSPKNKTKD